MQYFIGVIPPKEIQDRIINFQQRFFNKKVVEPHITIKAQSGLTEDKVWLEKVENYLKQQPSFKIELKGLLQFGDDILFFRVLSDGIEKIHKDLVDIVNPSKELREKYFENQKYKPHLTLAETRWGISKNELVSIKLKAEQELNNLPSFNVDFARVYVKSEPNAQYEKLMDIYFKKQ
jgi:2'-5' RNA ligase